MGDINSKRINCIDGLKGICACIIAFVWHFQHFALPPYVPFNNVFYVSYRYGDNIVELFFMLSGLGMAIGYGDKVVNRCISFIEYIKKRIAKLYPLFLLSTLLVIVLELLIKLKIGEFFIYPNFDLYHLVLNLLLLQNGAIETEWSLNSPSWVISVLMVLYCLYYLVCYLCKDLKKTYYVFAIGVILGSAIILSDLKYPIFNVLIGRGLACFSMGVLLRPLYENKDRANYKFFGYLGLLFVVLTYFLMRTERTYYVGNFKMLMILGLCPLSIFSSLTINWLNKLLSLKPFVLLGKISIAIYLFHFPVQCLFVCISRYIVPISFNTKLFWICYSVFTIIIASIYTFLVSVKYEAVLKKIIFGNKN